MAIPENEAKQILAPYIPSITKCIEAAVQEYLLNVRRIQFSKRTRASIINDLIIDYAFKYLQNEPGIRWSFKRNCFYFFIQDKFKLKFKMFDKNLKTRNIPTQQVLKFINQQENFLNFPDLPPAVTNIFAGYRWNYLQTEHEGFFITCPDGSSNLWVIELISEKSAISELIPINAQTKRKRVTPRKVEQDVKEGDE
ncbi:hypothetical protein [Desulfotruncus alcoholivorax]|uniref:hypothetical protein n=1 Tax=Desulfotruncus alcoholivorax TaxID=265477 RepID=UPI0004068B54|nr:hypothetical protein [Desulfotruncus alcoholivorax]